MKVLYKRNSWTQMGILKHLEAKLYFKCTIHLKNNYPKNGLCELAVHVEFPG